MYVVDFSAELSRDRTHNLPNHILQVSASDVDHNDVIPMTNEIFQHHVRCKIIFVFQTFFRTDNIMPGKNRDVSSKIAQTPTKYQYFNTYYLKAMNYKLTLVFQIVLFSSIISFSMVSIYKKLCRAK